MRSPEETSARLPHLPEQAHSKNTRGLIKIRVGETTSGTTRQGRCPWSCTGDEFSMCTWSPQPACRGGFTKLHMHHARQVYLKKKKKKEQVRDTVVFSSVLALL